MGKKSKKFLSNSDTVHFTSKGNGSSFVYIDIHAIVQQWNEPQGRQNNINVFITQYVNKDV
jgi:hypothetical protein